MVPRPWLILLAAIFFIFGTRRADAALPPQAKISAVRNVVKARNGLTGVFITGRVGVLLVNGDGVRTGEDSAAGLRFFDGTTIKVGELSDVTVRTGRFHDITVSGSILGDFQGPARIRGRNAVAASLGTRIGMTSTPAGDRVEDFADGPGSHRVIVAPATSRLIGGRVEALQAASLQSSTLVDDAEDWVGGRVVIVVEGQPDEIRRVVAFDPATGTLTLDAPPAAQLQATAHFFVVNPPDSPIASLVPGLETRVLSGPNQQPSSASATPSEAFAGGEEYPAWSGAAGGSDIQTHLAGTHYQQYRSTYYASDLSQQAGSAIGSLAPGVQTGVGAPAGLPHGVGGSNNNGGSTGGLTGGGTGGSTNGAGTGGVGITFRDRAFHGMSESLYVNDPDYSGLAYAGPGRPALLARARASAVAGQVFLRIGGVSGSARGRGAGEVDEAMLRYRNAGVGDIQAGRFHWFPGPVTNSTLGRLISFSTADGVLYQLPQLGRLTLQGAYLNRIDPLEGPAASGYAARVSTAVLQGVLGATALTTSVKRGRIGFSGDGVLPVLPQVLDLYGEMGVDPLGEAIYSLGTYAPISRGGGRLDLFLEHAFRQHFGHETTLSLRMPLGPKLLGILALSQFQHRNLQPGIAILSKL